MLVRSKTGVRAGMFRIGMGRASAWMIAGAKVFFGLFAGRSITQKDVAVGGQVWAATPSDG
jgi:hypothetical protein